jgi:integrase
MPRRVYPPLTDQAIRKVTPAAIPIDLRDGELRGLILTTLPSGKRRWTVRYRARDEERNAIVQRRAILGNYPALSIAKARVAGRALQSAVSSDHDPVAETRQQQAVRRDTVSILAAEYLKRHAKPKKKSAAEDERALNADVLPHWGTRSVRELRRRDVRDLLNSIVDRGSPVQANRVLALVRKMLNFAVDTDWIDANPAARMSKPTKERSRERVLSDDEIRRLWRCLERFPTTAERAAPHRKRAAGTDEDPICPVSPALADVQKLRLITAQRGGEVIRMRWRDLELPVPQGDNEPRLGWWTIPSDDAKNDHAHRVPLVEAAIQILDARRPADLDPDAFVFVGIGASMKDAAKKASRKLAKAVGFRFQGRDLRRTAATNIAAAGFAREVVSFTLNHIEDGPKATRVYDRYSRDREKTAALTTWWRRLDAILHERPADSASVVPIAAGRT